MYGVRNEECGVRQLSRDTREPLLRKTWVTMIVAVSAARLRGSSGSDCCSVAVSGQKNVTATTNATHRQTLALTRSRTLTQTRFGVGDTLVSLAPVRDTQCWTSLTQLPHNCLPENEESMALLWCCSEC